MKKYRIVLVIAALTTVWNNVKAQSYSMNSLEGEKVKVQLMDKSNKNSWYLAKISCLSDSLIVHDYNGMKEVSLLSQYFLKVTYNIRGGSGYQATNTMIICVKDHKINVAFISNSFTSIFGGDKDGSLLKVKFTIIPGEKRDFKLMAQVYNKYNSRSSSKDNRIVRKNVLLGFDPMLLIFYEERIKVNKTFTVQELTLPRTLEKKVNGLIPVLRLSGEYYYLGGEWFKKGYHDNLFKEYSRAN